MVLKFSYVFDNITFPFSSIESIGIGTCDSVGNVTVANINPETEDISQVNKALHIALNLLCTVIEKNLHQRTVVVDKLKRTVNNVPKELTVFRIVKRKELKIKLGS